MSLSLLLFCSTILLSLFLNLHIELWQPLISNLSLLCTDSLKEAQMVQEDPQESESTDYLPWLAEIPVHPTVLDTRPQLQESPS